MLIDTTLDKSNYLGVFTAFPEQFTKTLELIGDKKVEGKFENVIICGMGGSAMPYDLLAAYLSYKHIDLNLYVSRTYSLPKEASEKSLIIISSYSGNTEESLSCMDEAEAKKYTIVGFSRGGQIEERCEAKGYPYVKYPEEPAEFQPRAAIGYSFSSMLYFLMNSGLIPDNKAEIRELADFLSGFDLQSRAEEMAAEIGDLIPVIYTTDEYQNTVARIVKIKFNENAKYPAFFNSFPELNHNEMVGYTQKAEQFYFIFFKDSTSHPRILKRMEITKDLLEEKGAQVVEVEMQGATFLQKMFHTLLFGDYLTTYKALANDIDPTPVKMVEDFKKML
ncbi:bifunctional phosphoglucose/phosphomannose isomerase [Patescibacteria group bacterium]|nr:bifunctional phosphoglucose/phosphomannose isomerase [Patescibacteria group bacterium]